MTCIAIAGFLSVIAGLSLPGIGVVIVSPVAAGGFLFVLLFLCLAPALTDLDQRFHRMTRDRRSLFLAPGLLLAAYAVYCAATGTRQQAFYTEFAVAVFAPAILLVSVNRDSPRMRWQDLAALAAIWIPFENRWTRGIWNFDDAAYVLNSLVVTILLLALFCGFRNLRDVGYSFRLSPGHWPVIGFAFAAIAAICIPLGLASGFLGNFALPSPTMLVIAALGVFLTVAIPEELMFRGILQNLLGKTIGERSGLVLSALIFGATHFNNTRFGDAHYIVLASIAGLFYGYTYYRTRSIIAAALVHTMVDVTRLAFFPYK